MRILFVSNISWSLYNFRRGLMAELSGRGHSVVFCASADSSTEKLQKMGFRYIPVTIDRKGTNPINDLALIIALIRIYRKERPDIIFHNSIKPNIYGSVASWIAGIKCINTVSGLGYMFMKKNVYQVLAKIMYRVACGVAAKTFFQNKDDAAFFLEHKLVRKEKTALVRGSGVNTEYFTPGYCGSRVDSRGFVFLYSGRILWDKGIGELIEAMRIVKQSVPSARLLMLGYIDNGNPSGICREKIIAWQKEGLVEYEGETSDVRQFICRAHCVVLASYREGTPKSLLEASAMAKPVITTDAVGCREAVIDGVTGFKVPVKDVQRLAEAMQKMAGLSAVQREALGSAGRRLMVDEFSEKQVIRRYLRELDEKSV
jgi:glycosyltransferase involved in cell wall biosynthesis